MIDTSGVNVLWPHQGQEQSEHTWLVTVGEPAGLPPPYLEDNALTRHLLSALFFMSLELSHRNHVNPRAEGFRSVAYVASDPSITACCTKVGDTHVVIVGVQWLFRLVGLCDRLRPALARRPRAGRPVADETPAPASEELTELLWGRTDIEAAEALAIAESWPEAGAESLGIQMDAWTVFYDLVRLVFMHEWAHALCGHVGLFQQELGVMRFHESSVDRASEGDFGQLGFPTSEVMQCLEMHADEFSVRANVGELLYGYDPAGRVAGPKTDLIDRMLLYNTACCVFTVIWALDELKLQGDEAPATAGTHPPVGLRYDRFRNFQRQFSASYNPQLVSAVDAFSFGFVDTLTDASGCFGGLAGWTPMLARTPAMKSHEAYEQYLMRIGPVLWEAIGEHAFRPTADPRADSDDDA